MSRREYRTLTRKEFRAAAGTVRLGILAAEVERMFGEFLGCVRGRCLIEDGW